MASREPGVRTLRELPVRVLPSPLRDPLVRSFGKPAGGES